MALHEELCRSLRGLPVVEIIFVDDGSRDESFEVLSRLAAADRRIVVVRLRQRTGKAPALTTAFARVRGARVVTMDADLQDDPADIPALLAKLDEGYDVVSGWRARRRDRLVDRRLPSIIANRIISRVTGVALHDFGGGLKAYRRNALEGVVLYGGMHRFLPALCHDGNARIAEIAVNHRPRRHGKSKYGLSRIPRVLADLGVVWVAGRSARPAHALSPFRSLVRAYQRRRMETVEIAEVVITQSPPQGVIQSL